MVRRRENITSVFHRADVIFVIPDPRSRADYLQAMQNLRFIAERLKCAQPSEYFETMDSLKFDGLSKNKRKNIERKIRKQRQAEFNRIKQPEEIEEDLIVDGFTSDEEEILNQNVRRFALRWVCIDIEHQHTKFELSKLKTHGTS